MTSQADRQKQEIFDSLRMTLAARSESGSLYTIGGHSFRKRRGKLVQIPDEWVGVTADRWPKKRPGTHDMPKKLRKLYARGSRYTLANHHFHLKRTGEPTRCWYGQEDP